MAPRDTRVKGIHVKLDKKTHRNFKVRTIDHGVSMQDAFEAFAKALASDLRSAHVIVERLVRARVKEELASVGLTPGLKHKNRTDQVNVLDAQTLYDLIDEGDSDDDNDDDEDEEAA